MNKQQLLIVAILGALMVCSTFAKEENHIGYQLIKNLQTDILDQIDELDNQWKVQKDLLTRNVDSWARTVSAQQSLCDGRAGDLAQTDKDIENTQGYIAWIEKKIEQNNARVQTLEELRCQANTLYINGIKNNKLSLSLIEYLYREISRVENLEMLQKMHVMTKLTLFIEAYKLGNVASLLDGSVFAQFKSHLREDDGEVLEEEEGADSLEDEDNEDALNEIENELNDDQDSGEGNDTYALGSNNDDGEVEATQNTRSRRASSEGASASSGSDESDGEWEDEDEEEEEQEEEEFEEDDEEVIAGAGSVEGDEESAEESSGEHHAAHHGSHAAAAGGDDEEESEETSAGRSGYSSSGSSHSGEQESSHGAVPHHGHVDWNVDTTSWPQYKKDLLDILVRLRNSILQKMKTAQDDEVNAGIALADYKVIIHRENEDLANALTNQQERLEELLVLQTKQQIRLTECQAELSTVSDSLYASKAELENSEAQYTENRKAAVEERDIYDYVVSIYEGKVEDRFRFKNNSGSRQLDNINF